MFLRGEQHPVALPEGCVLTWGDAKTLSLLFGACTALAVTHKSLFSLPGEQLDSLFPFLLHSVFPVNLTIVSLHCSAGQMPGPGSMIPGQPMPGRMMPSVSANIHPAGGGPPPPGMSPMSGNLIGPRVPLAAPNGMCKCISSSKRSR